MRASLVAVATLFSLAGCGGGAGACGSSVTSGDLYFTRYSGAPNLQKVHFDYSSGKFTLAKPTAVATLNGVDGVVFAPDGDLLVGGQGDTVHKVHIASGKSTDVRAGASAYHLSLDPGRKKLWASGIPGPLAEIPLNPFGKGVAHPITGDNENITSIAFDGSGHSYYTSSGAGGFGSVGRIDLKKFTTKRVISDLPAAHGMVFDRFTGNLLLFGSTHITQIDPSSMKVVSDLTIKDAVVLDQGTVDGHGYVFVASNNGQIVFVDYTGSKKVGAKGNKVVVQFVETNLDDVAPLSGVGAATCTSA
jgi:hypothetical protein